MNEMAVDSPTARTRHFLGEDRPQDLLRIVGAGGGFAVLDRLVRAGSTLAAADEDAAVSRVEAGADGKAVVTSRSGTDFDG